MHIDLCPKHNVPGEAGCMFCAADYLEARVKELEAAIIQHRDAVHRDAHLDWQLWSVINP